MTKRQDFFHFLKNIK